MSNASNLAANEQGWNVNRGRRTVRLVLSHEEIAAGEPIGDDLCGFTIVGIEADPEESIASERLTGSQILLVELRAGNEASMNRLLRLCKDVPAAKVVALVRNPSIDLVRQLMRSGVSDVLPLPLTRDDVANAIAELAPALRSDEPEKYGRGKLITALRSTSGVGVTTLITQAGGLQAPRDAAAGGETLIIDLDLQCGNVASYLGLTPSLTVADLIEAGPRLDRAMLLASCCGAPDRVRVLAAPQEIMPITGVNTDQILNIIGLAKREFRTILLDLPSDWTDWSLSAVAASDLVVIVFELTVASLRQARRQLNLLASQGLGAIPTMLVANRVEDHLFHSIDFHDAERVLQHPVSLSIANDYKLVNSAQNQGVLVHEIRSGSKLSRNITALLEASDRNLGRAS